MNIYWQLERNSKVMTFENFCAPWSFALVRCSKGARKIVVQKVFYWMSTRTLTEAYQIKLPRSKSIFYCFSAVNILIYRQSKVSARIRMGTNNCHKLSLNFLEWGSNYLSNMYTRMLLALELDSGLYYGEYLVKVHHEYSSINCCVA